MVLKIAILKETAPHETRVAASPDSVKKLKDMGVNVQIQSGAGKGAAFTDDAYKEAGAILKKTAEETLKGASLVLCVKSPDTKNLGLIAPKTILIGMHNPAFNEDFIAAANKAGITLLSMDKMPRITRAQNMDVLSSQSNLAGYKAVLDATEHFPRALPMMMTAAGTIPPAKIFIMGAGVAGLQAIATARRLGAVVSATDVRPAAKEQVESLGASFIAVEDDEFKEAETAGGYAKEMSADYKKKQEELIASHIAKQDIVITTALIPGRPAPKLITEDMVKSMKAGSVIVDLAVETGGNCELSEEGKVAIKHGVSIIGHHNVPGRIATDASALYARNILNLLKLIIDEKGQLNLDADKEIIEAIKISQPTKKAATKKKATAKKTTTKKEA